MRDRKEEEGRRGEAADGLRFCLTKEGGGVRRQRGIQSRKRAKALVSVFRGSGCDPRARRDRARRSCAFAAVRARSAKLLFLSDDSSSEEGLQGAERRKKRIAVPGFLPKVKKRQKKAEKRLVKGVFGVIGGRIMTDRMRGPRSEKTARKNGFTGNATGNAVNPL